MQRVCAVLALVLAIGYMGVRSAWALGFRWGYSACGYRSGSRSEAASGCGAEALTPLPSGQGWATVALSVVAVVVAAGAAAGSGWGQPRARPLSTWGRRATYAAAALPVLGWTTPHLIWVAGVPLGISHQALDEARQLSLPMQLLISLGPVVGALLTVGLAQRWGQVFPAWLPGIGGRRVPRAVALVPAGVVSGALVAYGIWGMAAMARDLILGAVGPGDLMRSWAVTATVLLFLMWGLALPAATVAYARTTGCRVRRLLKGG